MLDSNLEVEKEEMNGRKDEIYDAFDEFPYDKEIRIKNPS